MNSPSPTRPGAPSLRGAFSFRPWCLDRFPLAELLDGMIVSYEMGAMKPDAAMYERGLARFGLLAAECVFVDDLAANLDGARRCGIRTVLCESAEQVERDLAALGVMVN